MKRLFDGLIGDIVEGQHGPRYVVGELLGRGGMGEVMLAHDPRIGRDVALKRMHGRDPDPDSDSVERFLREARIQARLDHPAIVPVHDVGFDTKGRPYFTMKRLAGTTLQELIEAGAANQQRMLRALVEVCLAIELAHSRHVVHRDLKPANIMLGDFGEVYVIDWGVARLLADQISARPIVDVTPGDETVTGTVLGTPKYMAPEQARGEQITTATDVFALGSILFEILAREPLRPHPTSSDSTESLMPAAMPVDGSPARRRPDLAIPPELDAACLAALAADHKTRPSARELADRIQRYLDGDRDVERRRVLAAEQLATAREALASGDPGRRADAVHAAGRALALDPGAADAQDLIAQLIVMPPADLPPELVAAVDAQEHAEERQSAQRNFLIFAAFLVAFVVASSLLEVKNWPVLVGVWVALAACTATAWFNSRSRLPDAVPLVVTFVLVILFARVSGPFILTPVLIGAMLPRLATLPWVNRRRFALAGWTFAVVATPFALELFGVCDRLWSQTEGGLLSASGVFASYDTGTTLSAAIATAGFLVAMSLYARDVAYKRRISQHQLHIQNWHLKQLLPRT